MPPQDPTQGGGTGDNPTGTPNPTPVDPGQGGAWTPPAPQGDAGQAPMGDQAPAAPTEGPVETPPATDPASTGQ